MELNVILEGDSTPRHGVSPPLPRYERKKSKSKSNTNCNAAADDAARFARTCSLRRKLYHAQVQTAERKQNKHRSFMVDEDGASPPPPPMTISEDCANESLSALSRLVPRVAQPISELSFQKWVERYGYQLDEIVKYLWDRLPKSTSTGSDDISWNADIFRCTLLRLIHRTSINRFRAYHSLR
jgi:hypothetical protein